MICGGLLCTAYERKKVVEGLLRCIQDVIGITLLTAFTDADSPIVSTRAISCCSSGLGMVHDLCIVHEEANFKKCVKPPSHCSHSQETINLFHPVCCSRREGQIRAAIGQIEYLLPEMLCLLRHRNNSKIAALQ